MNIAKYFHKFALLTNSFIIFLDETITTLMPVTIPSLNWDSF